MTNGILNVELIHITSEEEFNKIYSKNLDVTQPVFRYGKYDGPGKYQIQMANNYSFHMMENYGTAYSVFSLNSIIAKKIDDLEKQTNSFMISFQKSFSEIKELLK